MYGVVSSIFLRVLKVSRHYRPHKQNFIVYPSTLCHNKDKRIMAEEYFKGQEDRYNGLTVDSILEPCEPAIFPDRLEASLKEWLKENRKTIWFRVDLAHADWVPILVKKGFKFHHAKEQYVTLYRWLPTNQECNVPPYAHTHFGVGAFVFNEETNEIIVIKENAHSVPMWKLPGGYVEPGEHIGAAAEREILEETGIEAEFKSLIAFRHGHHYAFGCSDIYMVACLIPRTFKIKKCDYEISQCVWMKLEEYAQHPEVHENNRAFAKKFIEYLKHRRAISATSGIHPIRKDPIYFYSISDECS